MEKARDRRVSVSRDRRISIMSAKKEALKRRKAKSSWRCGMTKGVFSGVWVTVLWVAYVFLGSLAFQYIEEETYVTEETRHHHHWARFKELAAGHEVVDELLALKGSLLEICPVTHMNKTFELLHAASEEKELLNETLIERLGVDQVEAACGPALMIVEHLTETTTVSLVDAIYYTMTAVTTIGYGHIHPTNPSGRLFCVFYCLVGVPLTCILMAKSTDLLSSRMQTLYTTAKRRHHTHGRSLLYLVTVVYLTVGFLVFMLLPSLVMARLEEWTLEETLYLTFITLTTIGFGDFYPGYNPDANYDGYQDLYKMIIVVWIMLALGYWFLLLNFLQKVLRKNVPKRIKRTIKKSKRYTKQSEFFRQLVSKVMSQQVGSEAEVKKASVKRKESSAVVALMVEVADALADDARRPSLAVAANLGHRRDSCRSNAPLSLEQLLDVKVAVKGEAVPSIRTLVAQSPHPSTKALHGLLKETDLPKEEHEVVLPLREVITLVTLIKSVEDEVGVEEGTTGENSAASSSTPSSPISTVTSIDPQDYVPLIRSTSKNDKEVLHEVDPDDDDEDDEEDEDDDDEEEEDEDDEDEDEEDDEDDDDDEEKGMRGGRLNRLR